nr:long-chain-fatty-acid--coa ligase 1 [Quercus suber]
MSFDLLTHRPIVSSSQPSTTSSPSRPPIMGDVMQRKDLKTLVPQPKYYKRGPFTVEVPGVQKVEGETVPRRNTRTVQELKSTPHPDVNTIYDILQWSSKKFGNAKALGKRKLIKTHEETKKVKKVIDGKEQQVDKKWQYYELSPYHYISFAEFKTLALNIGSAFRALGLESPDRVHLFAATHPHWLAIAHGAASQSMPIVTAYDTLGEEGLKHSLMQTHAKAIFLDPHLLKKLVKPLKEAKDIKHVIYNDDESFSAKTDPATITAEVKALKDAHPHLTVQGFSEFVKLGEQKPVEPTPPKPEDLCCIMYTSGSTGTPKGVLLTHKNVIAAIAGVDVVVGPYLGPGDGLLTYLPLAHILEFVFENICLYWGGTMGYGNPKTIAESSVRNCLGDIAEFKPTILVGVPAVWETVKKGVVAKVSKMNPIVRNMFWAAMSAKTFMMGNSGYLPFSGLGTSVIDSVVFKKVAEATGGRMRICLNGGGPVAKETQSFVSMCIATMISGYGLTETSAMGALMDPLSWTDSALGELPGSVEVKLVDFPDAGYYATNSPPQGEIWIRGDSVAKGYLDLPKETEESFTNDGWFKTGDIGEFDSAGQLRIIDRKKNLVKTLNGEYIALEKLESVYRSATMVGNICVYAAEDKNKPIAIIVPVEAALKSLASANGIQGAGLEDLCSNDAMNEVVLKELQAAGKKGGLSGIEILDGVVLTDEEWTPHNGLVTSAQKLNRKGLVEKYKKDIQHAYDNSSKLWKQLGIDNCDTEKITACASLPALVFVLTPVMSALSNANEPLPAWKANLISIALQSGILSFGSFTLKSHRVSPYFFNAGLFSKAHAIRALSNAYAAALHSYALADPTWDFDVLFGPAYKGIPLAATTCDKLATLDEARWGEVGFAYNRKEVKDHGEGGLMVGESLQGKKVVIVDDVMTAGTAIREAVQIIRAQGGTLVGIIVAVDRQEKMPSEAEKSGHGDDGSPRGSTIGEVRRETGVPVLAVLTLRDLMEGMRAMGRAEEVERMGEYYERYKPTEKTLERASREADEREGRTLPSAIPRSRWSRRQSHLRRSSSRVAPAVRRILSFPKPRTPDHENKIDECVGKKTCPLLLCNRRAKDPWW